MKPLGWSAYRSQVKMMQCGLAKDTLSSVHLREQSDHPKAHSISNGTYKKTIMAIGTPMHVRLLDHPHLHLFCVFLVSSDARLGFDLTTCNSPFLLLLIDMRNRLQNPGLPFRLRSSNSEPESELSPSSSDRNEAVDWFLFWLLELELRSKS